MGPGSDHHGSDGSGATQLEELFKKSSRDDESEPPIGHPPRFHRFDPWLARAAALRGGLAQAPSRAYDLLHNRPRKHGGGDAAFFADSDLQAPGSLAMIKASNHPRNETKKGDGDVAGKGIMDENGRAGRRPGVQLGRGGANHAAASRIATGGERGA